MEAENDGPLWLRLSDFEERWAAAMPGVDTPSLDLLKVSGAGGGGTIFFVLSVSARTSLPPFIFLSGILTPKVLSPNLPVLPRPSRIVPLPPPHPNFFLPGDRSDREENGCGWKGRRGDGVLRPRVRVTVRPG